MLDQDSSVCPEEGRLPDAKQGSFTTYHWQYLVVQCCSMIFDMIFRHIFALCKRNKGCNLTNGICNAV
jgi:hypothetical protein